ncbi:MAG: PQQ-like beta-propeller repeat protein [Sandaracinaceae bacterium]|nr:PQQ-like beta-propeller repeat protein [Sandaracinaceae bacterium]
MDRRPRFDLERRIPLPTSPRDRSRVSYAVRDIVPLDAVDPRVLVSVGSGLVALLDVERCEVTQVLREAERTGGAATRVGAIAGGRVVMWGDELVEALDLATGASLWTAAEGDHSLDLSEGECFVPVGSDVIRLPNGYVLDLRDGELVSVEPTDGLTRDDLEAWWVATPDPLRGLLVALNGHLWRWDPSDTVRPFERRGVVPADARALKRHGDALYLVAGDGSLWRMERTDRPAKRLSDALFDAAHRRVVDARLTFIPEVPFLKTQGPAVAMALSTDGVADRSWRELLVTWEVGATEAPRVRFDMEWWFGARLGPVVLDHDTLVFDLAGALCVGNPRSSFRTPLVASTHDASALAFHRDRLLVGDRDCLRVVPLAT